MLQYLRQVQVMVRACLHRLGGLHCVATVIIVVVSSTSATHGELQIRIVSPNPVSFGNFGASVAGIPDLDGDGVSDLIVGAPKEGPSVTGRAYLFSGASGALIRALSPPDTLSSTGAFGTSVTALDDLNGDGKSEVAVGAPGESGSTVVPRAGRVHVYSGATGQFIRTIIAGAPVADSRFGSSVTSIADLNGDGHRELLIAASRGVSTGAGPRGYAFVCTPVTGSTLRIIVSPNDETGGSFAMSLSSVPDSNGDALEDIVIGAPRERGAVGTALVGRAYLFSGATGQLLRTFDSPTPVPDGHFGRAVVGMTDVNGDGAPDIAVGAPGERSSRGYVRIFGATAGAQIWAASGTGSIAGARLGSLISAIPDVNSDGRMELLASAPTETVQSGTSMLLAGRAAIYSGRSGVRLRGISSPQPENASQFSSGLAAIQGFGHVVGFAIGAYAENPAPLPTDAGTVRLFLADCNDNGEIDIRDLVSGAPDCNTNGTPDTCETYLLSFDCNTNSQIDCCEISAGQLADADLNGIPDVCEQPVAITVDCNLNGVPDGQELLDGDCNSNGVLDVCESGPFVSVASLNNQGIAAAGPDFPTCFYPVMTPDGRFVTFSSYATNLVPNDTNGDADIFVHDFLTGTTENVHVSTSGQQGNSYAFGSSISADGRFVAFRSAATNLVAGALADQIYLFDRTTRITELVSARPDGQPCNAACFSPSISRDGRFVVFGSMATDLITGGTNAVGNVFRRDRMTGTTICASRARNGQPANGLCGGILLGVSIYTSTRQIVVSETGRYVAFGSDASNLVEHDENGVRDVFVFDALSQQVERVSVTSEGGEATRGSSGTYNDYCCPTGIDMTPDGRLVLFDSMDQLTPDADPLQQDLFIRDRLLGTTERVRLPVNVGGAEYPVFMGNAISSDGSFIVFQTTLQLVPGVSYANAYRYTRHNGDLELVSRRPTGAPANDIENVFAPIGGISDDGNTIAAGPASPSLYGQQLSGSQQVIRFFIPGGVRACRGPGLLNACYPPLPISDFVNVLLGVDADPVHVCLADVNNDAIADGRDIQPYVQQLYAP